MGLTCQILRNESGEVVKVIAKNGLDSKLYKEALEYTKGNEEEALKLWASNYVDEFQEDILPGILSQGKEKIKGELDKIQPKRPLNLVHEIERVSDSEIVMSFTSIPVEKTPNTDTENTTDRAQIRAAKTELETFADQLMKSNLAEEVIILNEQEIIDKVSEIEDGSFSNDSNDIRRQVISEKGAQKIEEYKNNLEKAKELEKKGVSLSDISDQTGWYKFQGDWRMFSNEALEQFKINMPEEGKTVKLTDVLESENILFTMYPSLVEVNIVFNEEKSDSEAKGNYVPATNTINVNSRDGRESRAILAHELSHVIQEIEGLPRGGNLESQLGSYLLKLGVERQGTLTDVVRNVSRLKETAENKADKAKTMAILEMFARRDEKGLYRAYRTIMGEIDAHLVTTAYADMQRGNVGSTYEMLLEDELAENRINPESILKINENGEAYFAPAPKESPLKQIKSNFFSNTQYALDKLKDKNLKNVKGWIKQLTDVQKNGGVRNVGQELQWIGLEDYLNEWVKENKPKNGNVPFDVIDQYVKDNQIEVVEVTKGGVRQIREKAIQKLEAAGYTIVRDSEGHYIVEKDKKEVEIHKIEKNLVEDYKKVTNANRRKDGNGKYGGYTLEGGENYREVLLTLPMKYPKKTYERPVDFVKALKDGNISKEEARKILREEYESDKYGNSSLVDNILSIDPETGFGASDAHMALKMIEDAQVRSFSKQNTYKHNHWDERNVLAFVRINERILPNGERVLFVEEVQSDWAQEGKKEGFKKTEKEYSKDWEKADNNYAKFMRKMENKYGQEWEYELTKKEVEEETNLLDIRENTKGGIIPNMPYKKTDQWVGMAMRRVMQMAAQEGFDRVAWVTGEQSADRYDLSKSIGGIQYNKNSQGNYNLQFQNKNSDTFIGNLSQRNVSESKLEDFVGKEVAQKIINKEGDLVSNEKSQVEIYILKQDDLKVGGEGMKTFYNQILPKVALKEAQRFDKKSKVEVVDFRSKTYTRNTTELLKLKAEIEAQETKSQQDIDMLRNIESAIEAGNREKSTTANQQRSIKLTPKAKQALGQAIPLFQILGEVGASRLSNAEKIMANNTLAKELQQQGKDAKAIKIATGWELGVDGKWRYEIVDGKMKTTESGSYKLEDLYDSPALYEAYPELKSMDVTVNVRTAGRENSWFMPLDNSIEINVKTDYKVMSHLIHEIQHAIQFKEGFAIGGSYETFVENPDTFYTPEVKQEIEELKMKKTYLRALSIVSEYAMEEFDDVKPRKLFSKSFLEENFNEVVSEELKEIDLTGRKPSEVLSEFYEDLEDSQIRAIEIARREEGYEGVMDIIADISEPFESNLYKYSLFGMYQRLAGEVESRNVEKRAWMNEDKRRQTLLEKTESIPRDEQLQVFKFAGMESENQERIPAGFVFEDKVYLNKDRAKLDTPIHEFAHLFNSWAKVNRKDIYEKGIELVKTDKDLLALVKSMQPNLEGEALYEEALAQAIGAAGENIINEAKRKSFKNWLKEFWNSIKEALGITQYTAEEVSKMTLSEFTDAVAKDLLKGRDITENTLKPVKPGNRKFNRPLDGVAEIAEEYAKKSGIPRGKFEGITSLNKGRAKVISDLFEDLPSESSDPKVLEAYEKMAEETIEQYKVIISKGYQVEVNNTEPYPNSNAMIEDLRENKNMKIFSTESGFGDTPITEEQRKGDPRLRKTEFTDKNGVPLLVNDVFRFVHDFFGHAELGNGFGPIGEENAWHVHSRMYSPLARRAMTTETRGQNSYVNFSGINAEVFKKRDKARKLRAEGNIEEADKLVSEVYEEMKFAEQKLGLLPEWVSDFEAEVAFGNTIFKSLTPKQQAHFLGYELNPEGSKLSDGEGNFKHKKGEEIGVDNIIDRNLLTKEEQKIIDLSSVKTVRMYGGRGVTEGMAMYNNSTKTLMININNPLGGVLLSDQREVNTTILHETIHAIINDRVKDKEAFNKELESIRAIIVKNKSKASDYIQNIIGYIESGSPEEVLTYAFTNKKFAEFLHSIESGNKTESSKTIWNRLIEMIEKILAGDSLLDEVVGVMNKYTESFWAEDNQVEFTTKLNEVKNLPIKEEGGLTFSVDKVIGPDTGIVLPLISKNITVEELSEEAIDSFIKENSRILLNNELHIGVYKFPESNMVSIDLNYVGTQEQKDLLLQIATELGQESLYDIDSSENIKTGKDGMEPVKLTLEEAQGIIYSIEESGRDILSEEQVPVGSINLREHPDGYQITFSNVRDEFQGMGIGTEMYKKLIEYNLGEENIYGDFTRTGQADAVWDKFSAISSTATVLDTNGNPKEVPAILLRQTDRTDSNGEATLATILQFIKESNKKDSEPMSLQEKLDIYNMLIAYEFESSKDLVKFLPEAISNKIEKEEEITNNIMYEEFIATTGEKNQFGKSVVQNPLVIEAEIAKQLAGITDKDEFDLKLAEIEYPSIIEEAYEFPEFDNLLYNKFSSMSSLEVLGEDLQPVFEPNRASELYDSIDFSKNSLLETSNWIMNLPSDIWINEEVDIKQVLTELEQKASGAGIDLEGLAESYNSKSQEEIVSFLRAMAMLENNENQENLDNFVAEYSKFFEVEQVPARHITELPLEHADKTLVYHETNKSEYESFVEDGLLKVDNNLYQRVEIISLDNLVEVLYNHAVTANNRVLPNEAYFGSSEVNNKRLINPENKEFITENIRTFATNNVNLLNVEESNFDPEKASQMLLYKYFYNNKLYVEPTSNLEQDSELLADFEGSPEYYSTQYLADFQAEKLKGRDNNTEEYRTVLSKFRVTPKGLELINNDEITKKELRMALEFYPNKDLKAHAAISRNKDLKDLFLPMGLSPMTGQSLPQRRTYYKNNKKVVPMFKGDYKVVDGTTISTKEGGQDFIRIKGDLFEKSGENSVASFYNKIPTYSGDFYVLDDSKAPSAQDMSKEVYQGTSTKVKISNLYTKKEEEKINNQNFNCI